MKKPLKFLSLIALSACLLSSVLYFTGSIPAETMKVIALISTVGWFLSTPFWIGRDNAEDCNT